MTKQKNQEIERKFLVDLSKWSPIDKGTHILQFYLSDNPTVRIRISDIKGFITIKGPIKNITRSEFEYEIPVDDARDMIKMSIYTPIEKTRYEIEHDSLNWTIDVFDGQNIGLVVAEIEMEYEDQDISLPNWVIKEVSNDHRYYNSNLSKNPFSSWN